MDLHGMARGFIGHVNPEVPAIIRRSNGYTTLPNGKQVRAYHPDERAMVQKQELTMRELQQIDNVVKQGVMCSIYVAGNYYGVTRSTQLGGDLFVIGGQTWKVAQVLEAWPDWCKLALVLQ